MSSSTGKVLYRLLKSVQVTPYASKHIKTEFSQAVKNYLKNAQDVVNNYVDPETNLNGWKTWNNTQQNLGRVRRETEGR